MCTAVTYKTKDHYFGRNLDLEYCYQETVTVMPRNYVFPYRKVKAPTEQYAMIGMAYVVNEVPLFYDATNERGLSMAGLNFPGNAVYLPEEEGKDNVAPFELIPWILGMCATVEEARVLLDRMCLVNIHFSEELPLSPLHWIIADRDECIVVEPMASGLKIYDNPVGVLTNNPTFDMHMMNLNNYRNLSAETPCNNFAEGLDLQVYSRGMGALGLPGDLSSMSRFVRAAFVKMNSWSEAGEAESVSQFFHILTAVEQQRGCVRIDDKHYEITYYSSCCNTDRGIYYYTTYDNRRITGVDMHAEDLESTGLVIYPLRKGQDIFMQN